MGFTPNLIGGHKSLSAWSPIRTRKGNRGGAYYRRSQKPFGLESYSDVWFSRHSMTAAQAVTKAFRLGVLFGLRKRSYHGGRAHIKVTKAFRLGVLFGQYGHYKNKNRFIRSQKPFGLESYSD